MSVPTRTDFEEAIAAKPERWICKGCGLTRYESPYATQLVNTMGGKRPVTLRCTDCRGRDWHHTAEPIPHV